MMELTKVVLEEMYLKEFLTIRDIAGFLEVNRNAVYKGLIKFNISRREPHEIPRIKGEKISCQLCGKLRLKYGRYKICMDCWAKENNRERYSNGKLVLLEKTPRSKRKFAMCLKCRGWISNWNKTGYCMKCWNLPGMKKFIANKFCKKCGKAITGHGKTKYCKKHSR